MSDHIHSKVKIYLLWKSPKKYSLECEPTAKCEKKLDSEGFTYYKVSTDEGFYVYGSGAVGAWRKFYNIYCY